MPSVSTTTWITIALIVLVVVRFLARELRERKIPRNRLWLAPALTALAGAFLFYSTLSVETGSLLPELLIGTTAGIAAGLGIGLAVDRFTTLRLSTDGTAIVVLGSWTTVAIWIGALLLRLLGRIIVDRSSGHSAAMSMLLNTAFVFVIAGAIAMLRWRFIERAKLLSVGLRAA